MLGIASSQLANNKTAFAATFNQGTSTLSKQPLFKIAKSALNETSKTPLTNIKAQTSLNKSIAATRSPTTVLSNVQVLSPIHVESEFIRSLKPDIRRTYFTF